MFGFDILGNLKKALGGNVHEWLGTVRGFAGDEHVQKGLKATFPFFSTVDELLAMDGVQIALREKLITHDEAVEFGRRMLRLQQANPGGAARVIDIIGKGEQTFTTETDEPQGKGKSPKKTRTSHTENTRGAGLVAVLTKMTEQEMLDFLHGMGATITPWQQIERMGRDILANLPDRARIETALNLQGLDNGIRRVEAAPNPWIFRGVWIFFGLMGALLLIALGILATTN